MSTTTTAIKITANHSEGALVVTLTDVFEDIEEAIDIFNDLATEFDELHFCDVPVAIEHVYGEDPDAGASVQMRWLSWHFKAGTGAGDTLDMVVALLEDMQGTVESFEGDANAFAAFAAYYGADYLAPGDRVSFITYTRKEMIEAEIESLCLDKAATKAVRHLLDEDAILAQAEQDYNVSEASGNYYMFDN